MFHLLSFFVVQLKYYINKNDCFQTNYLVQLTTLTIINCNFVKIMQFRYFYFLLIDMVFKLFAFLFYQERQKLSKQLMYTPYTNYTYSPYYFNQLSVFNTSINPYTQFMAHSHNAIQFSRDIQYTNVPTQKDDPMKIKLQEEKPKSQVGNLICSKKNKIANEPESSAKQIHKRQKVNWSSQIDNMIIEHVQKYGFTWKYLNGLFNQSFPDSKITAKRLRQRYLSRLRYGISTKQWTQQEDQLILSLVNEQGNKWKLFQVYLQGRTQNQIKNRYYGKLCKLKQNKSDNNNK